MEETRKLRLIDNSKGFYLQEVDSTNDYILSQRILGSFVVAERQSSGRGRSGRVWISNETNNLYFSALVQLERLSRLSFLSLLCGKAVLKTCKEFFPSLELSIKWPNDIYLKDKKIAGILLEMQTNLEEVLLVIGIGVNFYFSSIPTNISNIGMLMESVPTPTFKEEFVKKMIQELNFVLLNMHNEELLKQDMDYIYKYSYLKNKKIQFDVHENVLIGDFIGYDENGFLLLSSDSQTYVLQDTTPNFGVLKK